MRLLLLNSKICILSPYWSTSDQIQTEATYLEQASIAFANAAVAEDIAKSAFLYAFAADISYLVSHVFVIGCSKSVPLPGRV